MTRKRSLLSHFKEKWTIRRINKILGIKLTNWQIDYIFHNSFFLMPGRQTGKTLAIMLKQLLTDPNEPIQLTQQELEIISGNDPDAEGRKWYNLWYARNLLDISGRLKDGGIKAKEVVIKF